MRAPYLAAAVLTAGVMMTLPPREPGIAPLIKSNLRSASIRATSRF